MPLPPNIQIVPCVNGDAVELGAVASEALSPFDLSRIYNAFYTGDSKEGWTGMIKAAMEDSATNWLKAVEMVSGENGKLSKEHIVAFARYDIRSGSRDKNGLGPPGGPLQEADLDLKVRAAEILREDAAAAKNGVKVNDAKTNDEDEVEPFHVRRYLGGILKEFESREKSLRRSYIDTFSGVPHLYVKHLFVLSSHQRKGIGKLLLNKCIEVAEAKRVPAFLVASSQGHSMYLKAGFEGILRKEEHIDYWAQRIKDREIEKNVWEEREAERRKQNLSLDEDLSGSVDVQWTMIRQPNNAIRS